MCSGCYMEVLTLTMINYEIDDVGHALAQQDLEPGLQLQRLELHHGWEEFVRVVLERLARLAMPSIARRSSHTRYAPARPSRGPRHT